jgi:hypothetical protein
MRRKAARYALMSMASMRKGRRENKTMVAWNRLCSQVVYTSVSSMLDNLQVYRPLTGCSFSADDQKRKEKKRKGAVWG